MMKLIQTPHYRYNEELEVSDDNIKIYHEAYDIDGKTYRIDYSPYFKMTQEAFELWIETGMPSRSTFGSTGPMTVEQVRKLKRPA